MPADAWFEQYRFRDGEVLPRLRLHYATLGTPHRNAAGEIDNAVLVVHWTGVDGSALLTKNYVDALFAPGRPLDAARYYLIFPDNVGHGRSSKPSDGLKGAFPHYGYGDMVDLQHRLVTKTLGITHLRAILGMSMGGMNAWQWAEAYPGAMDGIMPVVSQPIPISGRNILWRRIVIDAIESDPQWNRGNYTSPLQSWVRIFPVMRMMLDGVPHFFRRSFRMGPLRTASSPTHRRRPRRGTPMICCIRCAHRQTTIRALGSARFRLRSLRSTSPTTNSTPPSSTCWSS